MIMIGMDHHRRSSSTHEKDVLLLTIYRSKFVHPLRIVLETAMVRPDTVEGSASARRPHPEEIERGNLRQFVPDEDCSRG